MKDGKIVEQLQDASEIRLWDVAIVNGYCKSHTFICNRIKTKEKL
jgi:hypothetical protein